MDGRYAPSPSGPLHLGNLRTALLAWLFARSAGSRFGLRIEDLDPERSRERWVESQLGDLTALGLEWDGHPTRQSERTPLYEEALDSLRREALIYECFCTRREIREAASAPHGPGPEGAYPGTCRELSSSARRQALDAGRRAALRVRAGGASVAFTDRLQGEHEGTVDDFVVRRNDGAFAYNLAVVVDDGEQGIAEVVRGADLLDSTPRQLWLAARLGLEPPGHVHVPVVLGPDGQRLAKRHGAVTLADRIELGESAAEVRAVLAASMGLCEPGERPEIAELLTRFDPEQLPHESAQLVL